jgi:hypothetical protein
VSKEYRDLMDRREAVETASAKVPANWPEAALEQLLVQRHAQVHRVASGASFDGKDARLHILAIDKIGRLVRDHFGVPADQPALKKRGRPPKVVKSSTEPAPAAETPRDADERMRHFASILCPMDWQTSILPVFEKMAEQALADFLEATELVSQDQAHAEFQEINLFVKKLHETQAAGERAQQRLMQRRVA